MRRRLCGAMLIAMTVMVSAEQNRAASQPARAPDPAGLSAFIKTFLAEPEHTGDMSPAAFAADLARTRDQLAALRAMDVAALPPDDALDRRFVESLLARRLIEQERMRRWRMDPRVYMRSLDELAATLDDAEDAAGVLALLKRIPQDLRFGRRNLTLHIAKFQELALSQTSAGLTTLDTGVANFAETVPDQKDALVAAGAAATEAVNTWVDYLAKELPRRPTGYPAVGIESYNAILRHQLLLPYNADELYGFAISEFERTVTELKALADTIDDTKGWLEIAGDVEPDDLDADGIAALYLKSGTAARGDFGQKTLAPVPWTEAVGAWQFTPDPSAGDLFGKRDPAVIAVQAHAAFADRVRELYQQHNTRDLRRARSAVTFTEGWPVYLERVAVEPSGLTDERAQLRLLQLRLLAITRAAVDIGLHTNKMTGAEAVSALSGRVGVAKAAAEQIVVRSADDPGSGLGYLGASELSRLREEFQNARGEAFSLADFHERVLKIGPLPIALVRDALLR